MSKFLIFTLIFVFGCTPNKNVSNYKTVKEKYTHHNSDEDNSDEDNSDERRPETPKIFSELDDKNTQTDLSKTESLSEVELLSDDSYLSNNLEFEIIETDTSTLIRHKYFSITLDKTFRTRQFSGDDSEAFEATNQLQNIIISAEHSLTTVIEKPFLSKSELLIEPNFDWVKQDKVGITYEKNSSKFRNLAGSIYIISNNDYRRTIDFRCSEDSLDEIKSIIGEIELK